MSHNFIDLDDLHEKLTAAGIEHLYTHGDIVITVFRWDYVWTVSENHIIYWGTSADVCESWCGEFSGAADAYDYIMDAYSKAQ